MINFAESVASVELVKSTRLWSFDVSYKENVRCMSRVVIRMTFNYSQTFFISSKNCIFLITFWFQRFDFTFPDRSSPNDKNQGKKGGSHKKRLLYFGN